MMTFWQKKEGTEKTFYKSLLISFFIHLLFFLLFSFHIARDDLPSLELTPICVDVDVHSSKSISVLPASNFHSFEFQEFLEPQIASIILPKPDFQFKHKVKDILDAIEQEEINYDRN